MRLQDFMSRNVETVMMEETLEVAQQKMRINGIRHLVVMNGREIVGILSERDVANLSMEEMQGRQVEEAMDSPPVTADPLMTVREAANLMRGRTIDCLPVVDGSKLVGIITTTDLLQLLGQGIERITPDTEKRLITREHPAKKQMGSTPRPGKF